MREREDRGGRRRRRKQYKLTKERKRQVSNVVKRQTNEKQTEK